MTIDEYNELRKKHNGAQRKQSAHHESKLQQTCVQWFHLQYPQYIIYAVPNGGYRNKLEAAIMQGEGVLPGVPDLCIPVARCGYHGLYIEMKYGKNRLSDNQTEIIAKLTTEGYKCEVCYTLEEFMNVVNSYLNGK